MMSKLDSDSNDDFKYKVYLEERKSLVDAEREGSRLFDRAILTLAAWRIIGTDTHFSWTSLPRSYTKKSSGKMKSDIARLDPLNVP